jgi:uncharacterized protein YoaH (UPF0181 family)
MTPKHRLKKMIGSLNRIIESLSEGLTPKNAINSEAQLIRTAEQMTNQEGNKFRDLLTACTRNTQLNAARLRREKAGSNADPVEDDIRWP